MDSPDLRNAGFEVVDSPSYIRTPCINLGEFEDDASPLPSTFCQHMTEDEFEARGATETEKALQALVKHLEENKSDLLKVLRKRKKEEIEGSGLVPMLKSRLLSRVQGDRYQKKLVSESECSDKLSQLTQGMLMVFNYSQETKGQRFSKRLAAKRGEHFDTTPLLKKRTSKNWANKKNEHVAGKTLIPPPPPLSANLMVSKPGRSKNVPPPPPVPPPALTPFKDRSNMLQSPAVKDLKRPPLRSGSTGSLVSVHEELLSSNPLQKLRPTADNRSPGGTPARKRLRRLNTSGASVDMSTPHGMKNQEPLAQAFLRILEQKFRNIRSPSPGPVNNTVSSPGDFSP